MEIFVQCPYSLEFTDCTSGETFYSTDNIKTLSGYTINSGEVYQATINGITRCVTYNGISQDTVGVDVIILTSNNLTNCSSCST